MKTSSEQRILETKKDGLCFSLVSTNRVEQMASS